MDCSCSFAASAAGLLCDCLAHVRSDGQIERDQPLKGLSPLSVLDLIDGFENTAVLVI